MSFRKFITSKSFFIHLSLIILSFILLLVLALQALKIYTRHGDEFVVPDINGRLIQDIEQMDEMSKFEIVVIDSIYQENAVSGSILSQEPVANSKAKKGRKIYITIASFSGDDLTMPNCTDVSLRTAVQTLTDLGLRIGNISFVTGDIPNIVTAQKQNGKPIRTNSEVKRGSVIDLVVEMGENNTTTYMPDILGKTEAEAEKLLWSNGLNVGTKTFDGKRDRQHSRVVSYTPTFKGLTLGTTVSLHFINDNKNSYKKSLRKFEEQLILEQNEYEDISDENSEW